VSARAALRGGLLGAALARVALEHGRLRLGGRLRPADRAAWLQESASRVLRSFAVDASALGEPPRGGLLVSNHLGYLDVLVYAALMPAAFVAKQEVRGWPVFGALATMAGTIYVRRQRRDPNLAAARAIAEALEAGITVILFPEGTSTDGGAVLPFRSRFFEPAVRARAPIAAAAIGYRAPGSEERRIAYQGRDVLLPHLARTLGVSRIEARVAFSRARLRENRKAAALATHGEVEALRAALFAPPAAPCSRPAAG
jgi:1-acyl-sn-glycerol-3-phosphate acyltransferase